MGVRLPVRVDLEASHVLDAHARRVLRVVVGEVRVERDRVEALGYVEPAVDALGHREPSTFLQLVLHFLQAQRRADRHEELHVAVGLLQPAQHLEGDHRALAVADHDVRPTLGPESLGDARFHARAFGGHVEEVAHVLEKDLREELGRPAAKPLGQRQRLRARACAALREVSGEPLLEGVERLLLFLRDGRLLVEDARPQRPDGGAVAFAQRVASRARSRLGDRIAFAVHPVAHARAIAHRAAEERGVPLALEDGGLGLVADAVHEDDGAHLGRGAVGGEALEERGLPLAKHLHRAHRR